MKKILSMALAVMIAVGSVTAYAVEVESEGTIVLADGDLQVGDSFIEGDLEYTVLDDGTLEVSCPNDKKDTLTQAVIPFEVDGMKVTGIGDSAFSNCGNLTLVTIPDSIMYIGMGAFCRCTSLTSVTIPTDNIYIDWGAFGYCENLQSVTLPRRVRLDMEVFSRCNKISNVYYGGTEKEWKSLSITYIDRADSDPSLFKAKIHCALKDKEYTKGTSRQTTAQTEYAGSNIGLNDYNYLWSQRVRSYLTETANGLMRVQFQAVENKILVEYYTDKFEFKSSKLIDYELPLFGGFYETEKNYYILSGQSNYQEDNSVEVCRVTKYDKNWNRLASASLYGANTTVPFDGGSARMAHKDNRLVVRTCHEMYASRDGLNHQANLTFMIDTDKMEITDCNSAISNIGYGYCSHSFNQFVEIDENNVVAVDHGDGHPRSVVLFKYHTDIATGILIYGSGCSAINMLPISGQYGENYTGVQVGGFEVTDSSYIVAGISVDQENKNSRISNVFVSATSGDNECEINFITDYTEDGLLSAANPQMVKIDDEKLILLWQLKAGITTMFTEDAVMEDTVYYTFLDNTGKQISEIKQISGNLSDCKPIVYNDQVVWYTWNENTVTFTSINLGIKIPDQSGNLTAKTTVNGKETVVPIGKNGELDVSSLFDGKYKFVFKADNCAPRTYNVTVTDGKVNGLEDGVELHLYGDIDGDGKVNMKDVGKANAHAKNTAKLSGYDLSVSDINGDGKINMQDVGLMNAHAKNTKSLW